MSPHLYFYFALVLSGVAHSAPRLSRVNYPVFYLSPRVGPEELIERVAIVGRPEDPKAPPIISNRVTMTRDPDSDEDDYEISQFHTQDTSGRFMFGYHTPDQVRMEARNNDGTVKGSYSYIDPHNNVVKMQYWDDGTGFHVSGNTLPKSFFEPPQYTPEVQAARDEHFRLYQQALKIAAATSQSSQSGEENSDVDSSSSNESSQDSSEKQFASGAVVDTGMDMDYPNYGEEMFQQEYQKFQGPSATFTPNHIIDEELEAIVLDNPELRFNPILVPLRSAIQSRRQGKNLDLSPGQARLIVSKSESPEESRESQSAEPVADSKPVKEEIQDDTPEEQVKVDGPPPAYHFEKLIPVEVKPEDKGLSLSLRATEAGSIPIAAVHDAQVSPKQRDSIKDHQILPVYISEE